MRWDNLTLSGTAAGPDGSAASPAALFARGAVTRTFDTPGFRGITFYETQARSIINKVPPASRMSFRWTINPYRGCSHSCVYCLRGDTPVLMADGRTKRIDTLRVGEEVYGTVMSGAGRRYAKTRVSAHWRSVKPAYRVALEDGTELIASGDHRFLSDHGWRYVNGGSASQRPYLTTSNKLMGPGRFAMPPADLTAPAVMPSIEGMTVLSDAGLRVASVEPLGVDVPMFDITTGTGDFIANGVVSHNCFARNTHTYLDLDAGVDFNSKIVVKVNAPELARKELAAPKWRGEHVAMGTNVDCYQRAEGRYRLMPGIISALRDAANPFSILTKGTLILRDIPVLLEAAQVADVGLNVSVGFVDKELWRLVEPGTPSPHRRLEVCATFNDNGLGCGVLMGPVLPFLSDSPAQLTATVRQVAQAGAPRVSPIVLHLRPGAREWFGAWLREHYPELVPEYRKLYGNGSYAPKWYTERIADQVRELARRYGVGRAAPGRPRPGRARGGAAHRRPAGAAATPARPGAPDGTGAGPTQLSLL